MPAQPVTCPDCQATLQIDDKLFGKPVACGSCRKTFVPIRPNVPVAELKVRVPAPPAAPPPAPPPPMPVPNEYSRETAPRSNYGSRKTKPIYDEDEEVEERDKKPQRNKPKRSSNKKSAIDGKLIAMSVGGLVAFVLIVVGMIHMISKSGKAEVASTSPTPAIGG